MIHYDNRHELAQQTAIIQTIRRMKRGVSAIHHDPRKYLSLLAILGTLLALWLSRHQIMGYTADSMLAPIYDLLLGAVLLLLAVAVPSALSWAWGGPLQAWKIQNNLIRAGFVNNAGEPPALISANKDPDHSEIKILIFDIVGLPIADWLNCTDKIQTALNGTIADIRLAVDEHHFQVSVAPPATVWPTEMYWTDCSLSPDNFVLTLGWSPIGPVTINLADIPHILLGGSTGSGKTVLLKVLLRQALCKNAQIFIADFKGGADFGPWWRECCDMNYDMDALLEKLNLFINTLEERKQLFRDSCCSNIDKYNAQNVPHLHRMIFACDEVAAMLDKTGRSKAQKEQIDQVVDKLSTLAAQGRSFGLHLFLATQRPSADMLPGMIRSNIDFKVCGRADSVLSSIIIDSTAAADLIPKDAKGRFILNDGSKNANATVFQAYNLFEEYM